MRDFLSEEKGLCAEVESLCMTDPDSAHALIDSVISDCGEVKSDRAQSASVSRICCRFLMHRKMKSRLVDTLKTDDSLRKAIFGELNTYKYSLVFLFRRLIRLNETELTQGASDPARKQPLPRRQRKRLLRPLVPAIHNRRGSARAGRLSRFKRREQECDRRGEKRTVKSDCYRLHTVPPPVIFAAARRAPQHHSHHTGEHEGFLNAFIHALEVAQRQGISALAEFECERRNAECLYRPVLEPRV